MFAVNDDLSIYVTRGDIVSFPVQDIRTGEPRKFQVGEVVRFKVFEKKNCEKVVLQKDFPVEEVTESVMIFLTSKDTKIGEVISKPKDYWYEVELNPYDNNDTFIGYDDDGARVFRLYPEGGDVPPYEPEPEAFPVVDEKLDMTSPRPVANQVIARAFGSLKADFGATKTDITSKAIEAINTASDAKRSVAVEQARIDSLVSAGSVDGSEVTDIRVGADGTEYASAGSAVREQIAGVHTLLSSGNFVPVEKESPILTNIADHYVNGSRGVTELAGYTISHFNTSEATQMYFEVDGEIDYLTLTVVDGGVYGNVVAVYRDDTLPLEGSPVEVSKGMTVAISHRDTVFRLCHNSSFLGFEASYQFNLNDRQKNELREPVVTLTDALTDVDSYLDATPKHHIFTYVFGYVDKEGILTIDPNNPYETYYFTADRDFLCYFDRISSGYLSLSIFNGAFGDLFEARYRYFQEENNLPYADSPIQVKKGQTVAITCNIGGWFNVWGNKNLFGVRLNSGVYLGDAQMKAISAQTKHNVVRYEKSNGASYSTERLFIYIPTYIGYVGYEFAHVVNAEINADNWRLIKAFSCDDNFEERFSITNNGEWEMAIRIDGRSDFIGGSLHGDEVLNGIAFLVDGVRKSTDEMTEHTTFETLHIAENTTMYDPADNVSVVATHGKEYIFTAEGLTLKQFVNWTTEQHIVTSYMTMLPILRGNDAYSELQVSDTYYADNDFLEYDIAAPSKTPAFAYKQDVHHVTVYSGKSGVCASVEIVKAPDTVGGGWFQVSDSASYNKIYFTCAGYIDGHTTRNGERWETETRYKLTVNEGTDV